ncbi:hypothetical protein KKB69_02040 [Patescibacteria group bacterium]|nr:hypothetical protein [Patescibacteria group bacterium]
MKGKLKTKAESKKTAQEIQDESFRKMSADHKLALAFNLWKIAKELSKDNFKYAIRPATSFDRRY